MLAHLELELEPIDILSSNSRKLSYKRSSLLIRFVSYWSQAALRTTANATTN